MDKNSDYIRRINVALKYIDKNIDLKLSLEDVAAIACYSEFHFHRIFTAIIGEPLNAYIIRKRIEKSVSFLLHKRELSIGDISFNCGFSSNSSYTRSFKKIYNISPAEFRESMPKYNSVNINKSKIGQENFITEKYICNIINHLNWIKMNANIEVKKIKCIDYAYVTHIGVNGVEKSFDKIIGWAQGKGLLSENSQFMRLFHDNLKITDHNKARMSIGMILNEKVDAEGEVATETINSGRYIISRSEITPLEFEKAWSSLFIWMNENGYNYSGDKPFEIYHNDFRTHPEGKCIVDMYIPIMDF